MSVPRPMEGRASGSARIYQAGGDQYIEEHVHHHAPGSAPLFGHPWTGPAEPREAAPDSVRMPLVGRAPRVLRDRTDLMERLRAAVAGPGSDIQVLHGMGGCGKTAVAQALFTEAVRDHGRVGLWVNASERVSLRAGMLAVAGDRGATAGELAAAAGGRRAAADLVWHYLDQSAQPWLLVLDNADDPAVLEEGSWLRPSPSGTVLVTTRHATSSLWRAPATSSHRLGVLPLEDATLVLRDLAPDAGTRESARKVARRLGCLPLALTLAGAHLAHQLLESWSMDEYDRKLTEESTALVDRGRRRPAADSPATSWGARGSCRWTAWRSAACRRPRPCCGCCPAGRRTPCRCPCSCRRHGAGSASNTSIRRWPRPGSNRPCARSSTTR